VAAAAFGVFESAWVVREIDKGWALSDPATMLAAQQQSAVTALARLLSGVPESVARATALLQRGLAAVSTSGKPVFAGLRALGWPGTALGDLWRACDLYREHRGDAYITAWTSYGLSRSEACMINDLHQVFSLGSDVRTRGWSHQEVETAIACLRARGWLEGEQ
jgi:helix-turn-helix protein